MQATAIDLPVPHDGIAAWFATDDDRWAAVDARDARADGVFYYGVATTGVFCRPVCPARRPRRHNVSFHESCTAAEAAGFRACKLCRPREASGPRQAASLVVRPVGVLFADMRGFTGLAARLSPEASLGLLRGFHERMGAAIVGAGGVVHRHLGDGLMAVFGAEAVHRSDASRAVAAATAMLGAIGSWNTARRLAADAPVGVGIGVHYGMVAIGSAGGTVPAIVGDTVNIASRLERLTRRLPTDLVVSDDVMRAMEPGDRAALAGRLTAGGPVRLRGRSPQRIWLLPAPTR